MNFSNAISALLSGTRLGFAYDALLNKFDAASWSEDRSWRRANLEAPRLDITRCTREQLQGKALDFEQNSPLFNKLADVWEQYTVGSGLQFFPDTSDQEFNKAALDTWDAWKPFADVSSRFGFDVKQGVISRETFVIGGDFVLLTRDPSNNRPRIQTIEAHFCKTPPSMAAQEGKTIFDGVVTDAAGRPTHYWFQTDTKTFERFESWQVIHVFEPSRHGQLREIPYIACATNTLTDMLDLAALEMKHCKVNAQNSLNVYTESGEMPPGMGYSQRRFVDQATQLAYGTAGETEKKAQYYREAYAGRVNVAMQGDKIEEHVSQRPSEAWRAQQRSLAENVCVGVGIPYVLVYPDSMQGTVYRGSLDAAAAFFRSKSGMFASHFQRIYEYVINMEAAFNPRLAKRPLDWKKTSVRAPRAVNVDVGRNSNAMVQELQSGLRTYKACAAELGLDGMQLLREKADEAVFIRELADARNINVSEISTLQQSEPQQVAEPDPPLK